ncbi:GntR family transcriptional regulator [Prauserella marina]|nr:GntR family transcriptional regulator [Prauserella marina]ASR37825.1 GntR family transcriptional regulator [Prauserella marina]
MATSAPPYRRIVDDIQARIEAGELVAGDRLPPIRHTARQWGVAVATATKAMAVLRDQGLVEARVGSGTVVSPIAGARSAARVMPRRPPEPLPGRAGVGRAHIVHAAMRIADSEGLEALSMRRLAAELGIGAMSVYRHVAGKDELVELMADVTFASRPMPEPGPEGWRAKLELCAREQWELCTRHRWLPRVISLTRPLLMPNAMAHTEWALRAIEGLGLSDETRLREVLSLTALVTSLALVESAESEAHQESGKSFDRWWLERESRTDVLFEGGRFPALAAVSGEVVADVAGVFEYALARHLDGFALLVERHAKQNFAR